MQEQYKIGIIDDDQSKVTQMITMIRLCCNDEEGHSKINVVDSEGFIDPCTEEYDKHLIRLPDGSISGITPLGKYMRKTLQLYLKRHEIIHNLDKLKRKRDELKNSVAKDKLQGKECRKKEAALQLITESFFEYFNLWEKISQESA